MSGLVVCGAILFEGISTTVALAAVAVLGYVVGLRRRQPSGASLIERELGRELRHTLENSRRLESITDDLLKATREALLQSGRLREFGQAQILPHSAKTTQGGAASPRRAPTLDDARQRV